MATKPEKSFKCGGCEAAIFGNEIVKGGKTMTIKKVSFQKRYKSSSGEWESSHSIDANDIPKMVLCLVRTYAYLCSGDNSEETD